MVETDRGYRGEPTKVRIPFDYDTKEEKYEKRVISSRHETVNARLKNFCIFCDRFRHPVSTNNTLKHKLAFNLVVVSTQLSIANGEILFPVPYHRNRREPF